MRTRVLTTVLAAFGLSIFGAMSAHADDVVADQAWQGIDTGPGPYSPDVPRNPSAHTAVVDATTADVTWAAGEANSELGTSLETANLDLEVTAGTPVTVDYALLEGADPATNAVRLFIYMSPGADTLNDAPDAFTAAPDDGSTTGTLSLNVPADGTIGSVGLVYDTSNGGVPGTVRFTNLTVGEDTVLFLEPLEPPEVCEWDAELLADDEECVKPDTSETETGTETETDTDESDDPVAVPTAIPAGSELPNTGVNSGLIGLAVAGLLGLGVGGLWLRRRFDH